MYNVPDEWQGLVSSFESEAAQRGVDIDLSDNLIIEVSGNTEAILCGSCVFIGKQRKIQINQPEPCWTDEVTREAFIFHLLGHCALRRIDHETGSLPNGDPKSLMSGESIQHYACVFDLSGNNDCNNLFKRDYYLDELFDPGTPVPDWAVD